MKRKTVLLCVVLYLFTLGNVLSQRAEFTGFWGDQGNGTYINPVLNADYSDPDVVRVGEDFYMVCSEFHFMGMPVLHSRDLVNWTIIGRVYDAIRFAPEYDTNERYAGGSWAPSIRYHDDKFWIYFCTPDEGLFMTMAEKPEGPWEPLHQVVKVPKWEDPCPLWDDDGQAYLARSQHGAGPIIVHKMSPDGKALLDDGFTVYTGPVAEGPKFMKRKGFYYISIPEGGVSSGWQTVLRSKNIYGPYEKRVVLETGSTGINGPHQGGIVDTPNGEWWFFHFQHIFSLGRVCHLQPVRWINDWPVMGVDMDRNGIGEPVYVWEKPDVGKEYPIAVPQTSDEFNNPELDFQWAWNHNPANEAWSLTEKPGYLSLGSSQGTSLQRAKNTLTQKVMGNKGEATTLLVTEDLADGQKAGLCLFGRQYNSLGIAKENGELAVFADINGDITRKPIKGKKIYLRVVMVSDPGTMSRPGRDRTQSPPEGEQGAPQNSRFRFPAMTGNHRFYYSTDNKEFYPLGEKFAATFGNWKGPKVGLFSYHEFGNGGTALFDWFHYVHDGPGKSKGQP
jgi:beta-xylosidase